MAKSGSKKVELVFVDPEIWESLWRVVDASRFAICPARGQDREDALEFLADQEKMLRRAIGFVKGPPDEAEPLLRGPLASKHPRVVELEEQDRSALRKIVGA